MDIFQFFTPLIFVWIIKISPILQHKWTYMVIFQIVIPLKSFELSTYHPYCSINRHIWTCFKFSPHQNPLNYQNIIRTAAYKNIFQVFTPLFCFELSKYHPYCIINGHKWSCFNFFTPLKSTKTPSKSFLKLFKLT